ncbi:MAG: hypothetical protein WC956_03655 [bacterium]
MRKASLQLLFISLITLLMTTSAQARAVKMIFWYPGEAGSTVEGQPVLDAFFDYVNKKIAPDSVSGRYFNGVADGLQYIMKEKPAVGIISFSAWSQNIAKLANAKALLAVLPLPGGQMTERYALVSALSEIKPGTKIISSEPLSLEFVKKSLFPKLPADVSIAQSPQLFASVKKIADGGLSAAAILTSNEAATLNQVSAIWVKSLKTVALSEPVPTARLVLFDQGWSGVEKFKQALLSIGADPAAKDVMDEMRLKGFAETR